MKSSMLQSTSQDLAIKIEDTDNIAKEVVNIEGQFQSLNNKSDVKQT